MTVLKQYNTSTSTWDTVVVGQPGEAGIVNGTVAPADTSVLWMDTADAASQVAVPSGGTAGQVLAKTSGTDYATGWIDGPSRNVVINGGFDIWQRGTSGISGGWCVDRWYSDTSSIVSRSTDVPANTGINYSAKFTGSTLNAPLRQNVELPGTGIQGAFYDGSVWTVSFYAKVSAGTRAVGIYVAFMSSIMVQSRQIFLDVSTNTATTSWQRFTYTFTVPTGDSTASATGVQVCPFIIGSGSSVDVYITGVQLEPGSIVTPFRRNTSNIQAELAACQRYYFRVGLGSNGNYGYIGFGPAYDGSNCNIMVNFPVQMRSAPNSIDLSAYSTYLFENSGSYNTNTPTAITLHTGLSNPNCGTLNVQKSGSFNTGFSYKMMAYNNTTAYVGFNAEI